MEFNARNAYDALVSARSAPAGEAAGVDVVQLARDIVLAEQEFRRAGAYFSGERAREEAREQGLSDWARGLGWGTLAVASVTPFGTLGRFARAARAGQDVFEAGRAVGRAAEVAGRWDIPEGVDDLTRGVLEFQREAGVPFDEALAAVNRTRAAEGFEPVVDVARGARFTELETPRWHGTSREFAEGETILPRSQTGAMANYRGELSNPEAVYLANDPGRAYWFGIINSVNDAVARNSRKPKPVRVYETTSVENPSVSPNYPYQETLASAARPSRDATDEAREFFEREYAEELWEVVRTTIPERIELFAEFFPPRVMYGISETTGDVARGAGAIGSTAAKGAVAGGALGGVLGASAPAEASDESITSASIPFAATGIGTGFGAIFGAAAAGAGVGAVRILKSATGKSVMSVSETVKNFGRNRSVADDVVPNLNSESFPAREMDDIRQFIWNPALYDTLVGATKVGTTVLPKYQTPLRTLQDGFVDDVLFYAYDRMSDLPEAEILALEMNSVKTHVDALLHWQHVGNKNIQSILRNGDMPWHDVSFATLFDGMSPDMEAAFLGRLKRAAVDSIVKLDELTLGLTNGETFITYRGANQVPLAMSFGDDFLDALRTNPDSIVGMEFEDIAYTTTSLRPGYAAWMANTAEAADGTRLPDKGNVLFQIEVPAGTTSAPVSILDEIRPDHYHGAYYRGEAEILLPRNGVFEVTRIVQPEDIPSNPRRMTMVSLRYKGSTIDPVEARRPENWTIEEIP